MLLVGFWVPPAAFGWAAAEFAHRSATRLRTAGLYAALATFVVGWSAAWFLLHRTRIPPYIKGAAVDPTYAPPEVVAKLAVVTLALILPGSAVACFLAFRGRARTLRPASQSHASQPPASH